MVFIFHISRLASKLGETKSEKEKIAQDIQAKQDYLDTLQPKLAAILQVCMYVCMQSILLCVLRIYVKVKGQQPHYPSKNNCMGIS